MWETAQKQNTNFMSGERVLVAGNKKGKEIVKLKDMIQRGCLIVRGSTTTLSIGAFSDLVSFSTRIESPGLLVGKVTVISCSAMLLC